MKQINHHLIRREKQRGVGLLEILIALGISAIMLLAISHMYGKFVEASIQQKEQSLAQDQANFAFLSLKRAVRMSGAGICVRPTLKAKTYFHQSQLFDTLPPLLTDSGLTKFSASSRLHSFSFTSPSTADSNRLGTSLELMPDSDALFVLYSDSNTRRINAVVNSNGRKLSPQEASIYHDRQFAENRSNNDDIIFYDSAGSLQTTWVMVSDCEHTGVYKYDPSLLQGKSLNLLPSPSTNGGFLYNFSGNGQESLASRLYGKLFFVAKDSTNGIPHLYLKDLLSPNTDAQPIAAYVQKMKIEYLNIGTNTWVNTASRTNWEDNWPMRISLTMYAGSRNPVPTEDERTYTRILDIRN